MSKLGWRSWGGGEESSFKQRPDGWLFAAPYIWPRRTYLVTDEQKARLGKALRRMWWGQMLASIIVVIVLLTLLENQPPLRLWLAVGVAMVVLTALSSAYSAFAFRPLLAGLPPANERITRSDVFRTRAETLPTWLVTVLALGSLVLFAGGLLTGSAQKWDLSAILGTLFFGALSLFYIALFFAKQRAKRRM